MQRWTDQETACLCETCGSFLYWMPFAYMKYISAGLITLMIHIATFLVAIDGVLIVMWIYWILTDPWLQVIITVTLIRTLYSSLHRHLSLLSLLCLHPFSGNGFQRRTFPFLWVPELSKCLSYQLLTATAHNSWTPAVISLTHSRTH
jgi:hypothetical protein